MKRNLFSAYTDNIKKALTNPDILNQEFKKSMFSDFTGSENRKMVNLSASLPGLEEVEIGINPLKKLLKINEATNISFGDHPDFAHLRTHGGKENHYIVSCFIDVRKSTNLFKENKKYNHDQIASIIQTIQAAAIHTCSLFNGHIQRLQYDGVFVYFGGKNYSKEKAIKDSINASSFFSYFIKYELPEIFDQSGVEQINTRIGIDFGDDEEVSWYVFGVQDCSELTSLSLHTSLAPKMQANASSNGIVVGDNLLQKVSLLKSYVSIINDSAGRENRYVFTEPNYAQWKFDWEKYLLSNFSFVNKENGELYIDYELSNANSNLIAMPLILAEPDDDLFNIAKKSKPHSNG